MVAHHALPRPRETRCAATKRSATRYVPLMAFKSPSGTRQVILLLIAEVQVGLPIVVIHHVGQGCEASVMEEAALLVRPQPCQGCRAVHVGRRSVGLKRVDAELAGECKLCL